MTDEVPEDQKFDVPEPPVGIGGGFLTDYWEYREPLPKIKGVEVWWYFLQRGVKTVIALPSSSLIAIFTIAVSLFLLAGFLLVLQNIGRFLTDAGNTLYVTAYIKDSASEEAVTEFVRGLETSTQIRSVEYLSKKDALQIFREGLGSRSSLVDGLEEDNPLPASVDIVFRPDDLGFGGVENVVKRLRAQTMVVDEVVYGSEWVDKVQGVVKVFRLFGVVGILVVLAVIVFLISNTIKLVIYARRDEISIMQLVGASEAFVKIPFLIGGLFEGFVGSVLGLLILKAGFLLLNFELRNSTIFGVALPEAVFLNHWATLGIVFVGVGVGAVGSLFALGKFMNV